MLEYLPLPITDPWIHNFFSTHLHALVSPKINKHIDEIKKILQPSATQLAQAQQINNFLDNARPFAWNEQIQVFYEIYQTEKSLNHLNTKQLLILLQEHVLPLLLRYEYALSELTTHPQIKDLSLFQKLTEKIITNISRLKQLETHIYASLFARSQIYEISEHYFPRNMDDILAAVEYKMNIKTPTEFSATLDDDKRLMIYDILKQANYPQKICEKVTAPINKRPLTSLSTHSQNKEKLKNIHNFTQEIRNAIDTHKFTDHILFFYLTITSFFSHLSLMKYISRSFFDFFKSENLTSLIHTLWKWRILFYLSLSSSVYYLIIFPFTASFLFWLPPVVFPIVSNILFYSIGLAPIWWMAWGMLKKSHYEIKNHFLFHKKIQILESLLFLEDTHNFICNYLNQTIVDISHFDVEYFDKRLKKHQKQSSSIYSKLMEFSFLENKSCNVAIQEIILKIARKLKELDNLIFKDTQNLTVHIAQRVGEEIDILTETLNFILPPFQLKKLKTFIAEWGTPDSLAQFNTNSNVVIKWLRLIENEAFMHPIKIDFRLGQPWGGFAIRQDLLSGWKKILCHFMDQKVQQEACLLILELLSANKEIEINILVQQLEILTATQETNFDVILRKIQTHIFHTLPDRSLQNASLLHCAHKELIINWHDFNKQNIEAAQKIVLKIFNCTPEEQFQILQELDGEKISTYYELLDGADLYAFATNQTTNSTERQNKINTYFSTYSGDNNQAYTFLIFAPPYKKDKIVKNMVQKRMNWLLNNLTQFTDLHDNDIALFNNLRAKSYCQLSYLISTHAQFDLPNPHMEKFLVCCKNYGLISSDLLERYTHKYEKSPLLYQALQLKDEQPQPSYISSASSLKGFACAH